MWKLTSTFVLFTLFLSDVVSEQNEKKLNRVNHTQNKKKRFSFPMGGGGPGGGMGGMSAGGPFHPGGGPSSGGPMGMGGMAGGPHPGGMTPGGQTLFNPSHCLHREIICPQWCVMADEFGCRSCPCGPGGGMLAGSMGSFMSRMPYIGSKPFSHVSQSSTTQEDCIAVNLCKKNCNGAYTLGNTGADGCPTCTCNSHSSSSFSGPSMGGPMPGGGGFGAGGGGFGGGFGGGPFSMGGPGGGASSSSSSSSSATSSSGSSGNSVTNNYYYISTGGETGSTGISTMVGVPVQPATYNVECRSEEICTEMCGGSFELGEYTSDGCRACVCPPKQQVVYTQVVQPAVQVYKVQCQEMTCAYGCKVGYKCGDDGCPTCECALPTGYSAHQVVVQHQVVCSTSFSCTSRCDVGYQCGNDGCPTCDCLKGTIRPQTATTECYDCEWIDFLKPEPQMVSYVRPRPQTQTVYVEKTDTCHDCVETRPQVVYTRPEPQPVYVTNTHECNDCEQPKPQIIYERPKPQTVYVTGTTQTECHDCGTHTVYVEKPRPQTVYVEKPRPQTVVVQKPQPQVQYVVTQPKETECHNCGTSSTHYTSSYQGSGSSSSGIFMTALTAGHVSGGGGGGGGGMPVGIHGGSMSTGGGMAGYTGGGSGGSAYCPPMPHDCHPSCIKYDTPHCRRCECHSSPMHG